MARATNHRESNWHIPVGIVSTAIIALSGAPCARADEKSAGSPDKQRLPIALPEIRVIGPEPRPEVNAGAKLPLEATASVGNLPLATLLERATFEWLNTLTIPVPEPPDRAPEVGVSVDRLPYSNLNLGLGSLPLGGLHTGSYDFGLYHGRRVGPILTVTDLGFNAHGLDGWSNLHLAERFAWDQGGAAALAYRRQEQTPFEASALQEGMQLDGSWEAVQAGIRLQLGADVGRIDSHGATSEGSATVYNAVSRLDFTPDYEFPGHSLKIGLEMGHHGAFGSGGQGWAFPALGLEAADRFKVLGNGAIEASVGLALFRNTPYADPGFRLEFRPILQEDLAPATELWADVRTDTHLPRFEKLYQSRLRVIGNPELRPQRIEPRVELGAGHRFSGRLYGSAQVAMSRTLDWIHYVPAGAGLWRPANYDGWQTVMDVKLQSQYTHSETSGQRATLNLSNPFALGERVFTIGTIHDSIWLDDRLEVSLGTEVDHVEFSGSRGKAQGLDWSAHWEVGYRIGQGWRVMLTGKDWHIWQHEPAPGYFAKPALISVGTKFDF